jgi:hypothetical protein
LASRLFYVLSLSLNADRLEGILQQQQNAITQLTQHALPSVHGVTSSCEQDAPLFRTLPSVHTPHVPRPETALFLQKPSTVAAPSTHFLSSFRNTNVRGSMNLGTEPHARSLPHDNLSTPEYAPSNPPLSSPTLNHSGSQSQHLLSSEQDFPPYDLLYALADLYFKHVNTWCPILFRRATLDALFGPSPLDDGDRVLLHAIVATTLRFSVDPRLTPESRDRYHELSKQKVLLYGLENSSVKALQALVILALDLVGFSNGPPGWNLLALVTRSVVQLGLAVEATSSMVHPQYPSIYTLRAMVLPEPKDWIEEESRRRLFWMVYLLDRYATVATAFEFALDEKEIDRKLPCRDDLFGRNQPVETRWFHTPARTDYSVDHPENLCSFSYYIEVVGMLSRIHQFLKKPVDIGSLEDVEKWQDEYRMLDKALTSWKYNLPSEYGNMSKVFGGNTNKIVNTGWIMLHAAYNT